MPGWEGFTHHLICFNVSLQSHIKARKDDGQPDYEVFSRTERRGQQCKGTVPGQGSRSVSPQPNV